MKLLVTTILLLSTAARAQLTFDEALESVQQYRIGYITDFEIFFNKPGYGAPVIMTNDGGAAAFGSNVLYKLDKSGKEQWKREAQAQFSEQECQAVVQDTQGNLYAFMMSYNHNQYRGGAERVVCYDKNGKMIWDKSLGPYQELNNPTVAYIRCLKDGRIYMRGHIVNEAPAEGDDPIYRYWEGWLDGTGHLVQKAGDVIDWNKDDWQTRLEPDETDSTN